MKIPTKDLRLGDVVRAFDGPFGTAIVKQIEDGVAHLFRPYGTTGDFSYTGGVICYTGIETFPLVLTDNVEIEVYERKELL